MAYEAVESLQQTLLQFLQRDDDAITPPVKRQIISIRDKAVVLQFNLKHFPQEETITEVSNATQEIIQYLFSPQNLSDRGSIVRLSDQLGELAEEIDSAVGSVLHYCKSNSDSVSDSPGVSSLSRSALKSQIEDLPVKLRRLAEKLAPTSGDDVVGFDEDKQQMMYRLTGYTSSLRILSIVGMGGIVKSTLARHIYTNPMIVEHFDIRAWVTVSQDYSVESIHSQLLASLRGLVDPIGRDSLEAIEAEMFRVLLGRRYLVVMDDIWSEEAWHCVGRLFREDHNGSRIILTTRLMDVATVVSHSIHMMHFLDDEQSRRLFQRKVFGDDDCPLHLQSVGEKIVKGCGGLPLSIVNVAGLLSRIPRTPESWQKIEVNDGKLGSILSLSYNHLPPHLRKCFLYMAGFPQDYEIRASEIIKLWVAEGIVERRNTYISTELEAEEYLEGLIKQSLVLPISQKIDGKTKSCRLHSMVRDFCVRQAGQEKFLLSVVDYFSNPILRSHFLPQVLKNHPRISVAWYDLHLKDSTHSSCTTSIICIPQRGYRPKGHVEKFSSLRVFHVLRRNDHSYWELGQVFELIYLTYLASNIPDSIVPPAIAKIWNLQTLIIHRSDVRLPAEIWSLRQLRHLIAFSFCPLPLPEEEHLFL